MNYEQANSGTQEDPQSLDTSDQDDAQATQDREFTALNLAENLDDDKLAKIGEECRRGFEYDFNSRSDWERDLEEWTNLAKQVREMKTYPWPNSSNVKYPLLSTAAMQFAARAYPSLVPSNGKIVNSIVIGKDKDGQKREKADRVSTYMSYQIMEEMSNWEEDMDKMLMMLPVVGTMFKKTWYDKAEDKICSRVILPKNLVVNYWARCLDTVERISEIIEMSPRRLKERQNQKIFLDVDLGPVRAPETAPNMSWVSDDDTIPYQLIEQHTFLDLDDDGYKEPYIVTFERYQGKILSITPRYYPDQVELQEDEKSIAKITPIQMYTKFGFVPNPDGSFYDIGFGVLLGPINEAVNTLINQQIDGGTLNNLQGGFIGKSLRLKMGDSKFSPGEWKPVNATGDDLRKQIIPLPTKEPSKVLFELMGTLITSGKELASVAEIFVGKMPGQNTPATTTMASIEQGMKVFTAVYKRIFRSLSQEFQKIFELNHMYLDPNTYVNVIDTPIGPDDFDGKDCDIVPGADPTAVSQTEKLLKAQGLMELLQTGVLDPVKVVARVLDAQEQPNWEDLLSQAVQQTGQVPPQPDPKVMAIQAKAQAEQQKIGLQQAAQQQQMELDARSKQQQMAMDAQQHAQEMEFRRQEHNMDAQVSMQTNNIKMAQAAAQAKQSVVHGEQMHQQKMQQMKQSNSLSKEKSKSSQKTTS